MTLTKFAARNRDAAASRAIRPPACDEPSAASLPRGASTVPTTWIRCGTGPVTGLVMISIPVMISTSPTAPMPSPPTTSAPVWTRTFAPSGM